MKMLGILILVLIGSVLVVSCTQEQIDLLTKADESGDVHTYIGRFVWGNDTISGGSKWKIPGSEGLNTRVLDLRTLPEMMIAGGIGGYGIFEYNQSVNDSNLLFKIDNYSSILTDEQLSTLSSILGVRKGELSSNTLYSFIIDAFYNYTGTDSNKRFPFMPDSEGILKIRTMRNTITIPFNITDNSSISRKIIGTYWDVYRDMRNESLKYNITDYRRGKYLRFLDKKSEELNIDYKILIPPDLPIEVLPHKTTLTDNFNRADSDSLGSDWTEIAGDIDIVSNTVQPTGASDNLAIHNTDLSSDNHYCQVLAVTDDLNDWGGCFVRAADVNNFVKGSVRDRSGATPHDSEIEKTIGGIQTVICTGTYTGGDNQVLYFEINGNDMSFKVEGTERCSASESILVGNLQAGISMTDNDDPHIYDDFEAADLGGGSENLNQTIKFSLFLNGTQMSIADNLSNSFSVYYYTNVTGFGNLTRNGTQIANNSNQDLAVGYYNFTIRHDTNTSAPGTNVTWFAEVYNLITGPAENSCSPTSPLTADHTFIGSDNCIITTNLEAANNNIYCTSGGSLTLRATISNVNNYFGYCNTYCYAEQCFT